MPKRTKPYPLSKEKVLRAGELPAAELRLLVANYYQSQEMRKRMDMQKRHLGDRSEQWDDDIRSIMTYAPEAFAGIEEDIKSAFGKILKGPAATWCLAQRGIGPVLTAGLLAHIDIEMAPTVGHIWRFAGLDPTTKWNKGEKRPYNADLKQLTWHAGQCFMKQSNDPDCLYGRLYRSRKQFEIERNEAGGNAERAKTFRVSPGATKAVKDKLKEGKLPDFNIDARARRYAVKIFLSHLHCVMFFDRYKKLPPTPWAIQWGGHAHMIDVPHAEVVDGLAEQLRDARPMLVAAE